MRYATQSPCSSGTVVIRTAAKNIKRNLSSDVKISRGGSRRNSKWGFAVLLLSKGAVATHAVTLWHRRDHFKEYYRGRFERNNGSTSSSSVLFPFSGKNSHTAATIHSNGACDATRPIIRAQSHKQHHFVHRFSRLSKRISSRPVDCCMDCQECMTPEELGDRCGVAFAVPRGGHMSHGGAGIPGVAETLATSSAVTPSGIPLNVWKIIFQAILTTINVVCWLIPLRSKKIAENKFVLSLANAFSGGVFLSLAFGHLIPECVHGFHGAGGKELNEALPYMIVLGGYLLIFFVEKVAFDAHEIMHDMQEGSHKHHHEKSTHSNSKATENGSATLSRHDSQGGSGRSAVILLGALAVHSILEMTALGLADSFGDSALLSLSIALHQVR